MNSALATQVLKMLKNRVYWTNFHLHSLNTRQYIKESAYSSTNSKNWHSIPLSGLDSTPAQYNRENESQMKSQS